MTIRGVGFGTATLVVTTSDGSKRATIQIKVVQDRVTGVSLPYHELEMTVGGVESNSITFTVKATQQEENAEKLTIAVSEENIVLDKNATSSPILETSVYNYNFEQVTGKTMTYEVIEGSEYLSLNPDGNKCSFEALGHGNAVVRIGIEGYDVTHEVNVKVIVPPDAVTLPEVFTERAGFVYSFSKLNPTTNEEEKLPFVANAAGENVCRDLKYSFIHENGESGDTVAVWEDGKISFRKTGKITVLVSSDSGSRIETTKSYTFDINEGYNVYSYVQLQRVALMDEYDGQPINVVVLEKPDGSALNYEYGFDLVPAAGLKAKEDQKWNWQSSDGDDLCWGEIKRQGNGLRINFVCKSVELNGNRHKIDLSQIRPITQEEINIAEASGVKWENIYAVISVLPWSEDESEEFIGSYTAKIRDLEIVGNTSMTSLEGTTSGTKPLGVTATGIAIGTSGQPKSLYYVDLSNLKLSCLDTGISMRNVVGNGLVEGVNISNCYHNGLEAGASTVRFKDMTFSSCGSAAIELVPFNSNKVGENFDQQQTITFEGYIDVENNKNNGDTKFLQNYKIGSYTVPTIINGILAQYNNNQISHMRTADGEYKFVCFTFLDFASGSPNYSVYNYPAYQAGGFINAKDLPKEGVDTTHQYIVLDVDLSTMGLGYVGTVLLYNANYVAE